MISSIIGFAYDCRDADKLADFCVRLLGWKKTLSGQGWAGLQTPQGLIPAFQAVEKYLLPLWPWPEGEQQQMASIDFKAGGIG